MTNPSVHELRKQGYKVRVIHMRNYMDTVGNQLVTATRRQVDALSNKHLLYVLPRGGSTKVELKTPEGRELTGYSSCSSKDPFNRKLGLKIALNRALAQK